MCRLIIHYSKFTIQAELQVHYSTFKRNASFTILRFTILQP